MLLACLSYHVDGSLHLLVTHLPRNSVSQRQIGGPYEQNIDTFNCRQLVRDLDLPVEIVACPTVRGPDGLALSSRNAYLSADERAAALSLSRGLMLAKDAFAAGERDADMLRSLVLGELEAEPLVRVDYVSIADDETLAELAGEVTSSALLSLAAHVGKTHLIDNVTLGRQVRQQGLAGES